jgi:hypothetical protein
MACVHVQSSLVITLTITSVTQAGRYRFCAAEFHVSETPSGRVTDPKKVNAIKSMLSLPEYTGVCVGGGERCSTLHS